MRSQCIKSLIAYSSNNLNNLNKIRTNHRVDLRPNNTSPKLKRSLSANNLIAKAKTDVKESTTRKILGLHASKRREKAIEKSSSLSNVVLLGLNLI
jgi:hypothetical protein